MPGILRLAFLATSLIAPAGITQQFEQMMLNKDLACLWEWSLSRQLLWYVDHEKNTPRSSACWAHSWSWSCADGLLECKFVRKRNFVKPFLIEDLES
jgi:hypothetical protein